jgi:3-oxoacyl-(acyl-carrier-protein) synthase
MPMPLLKPLGVSNDGYLRRRPVITGIGIVGPAGLGKTTFWNSIINGEALIQPIRRFDASSYPCKIAAEVPGDSYRELIPTNKLRTSSRTSLYAMAATELALRDSRLPGDFYEPERRGVCMGTSLGGCNEVQQQIAVLMEKGANRVNPFLASSFANHVPALEVAGLTNAQGTHATFSTGCCASMHAIGHAAHLIATGALDCCLSGGTEAPIVPLVLATMCRTRELCCADVEPARASRPFDRNHSGLVLSEGSAILVLEELAYARSRGAPIYAEILAHTSSVDAADLFRVEESGVAGARALDHCLSQSGIEPSQLDYVCANGNSLPALDRKEAIVLKRSLKEHAYTIPASSIKGVLGHPFGAASGFQIAAACLAIKRSFIPPTQNLEDPDPVCDLDFVPLNGRAKTLNRVLVCSYGFGGINSYLTLQSVSPTPPTRSAGWQPYYRRSSSTPAKEIAAETPKPEQE